MNNTEKGEMKVKTSKSYLLTQNFCRTAGHDITDKATAIIVEKRKGKKEGQVGYRCRQCHNKLIREKVRAKGAKPQKNYVEPQTDLGLLLKILSDNPDLAGQLLIVARASMEK
jgi:hypothetical protein